MNGERGEWGEWGKWGKRINDSCRFVRFVADVPRPKRKTNTINHQITNTIQKISFQMRFE